MAKAVEPPCGSVPERDVLPSWNVRPSPRLTSKVPTLSGATIALMHKVAVPGITSWLLRIALKLLEATGALNRISIGTGSVARKPTGRQE